MANLTEVTKSFWIALDLLVISVFCILFFYTPKGFTPAIGWVCIGIFFAYALHVSIKKQFIYRKIPVILTTELALTIFYYILFFQPYLLHLLGVEQFWLSKFLGYTYENGANQGLILAVIGYISVHLGGLLPIQNLKKSGPEPGLVNRYNLFDKLFAVFFSAVVFAYVASGLQSADTSRYTNFDANSVAGDGIYVIIIMLCVLGISRAVATLANNRRLRAEHWFILALAAIWTLRILVVGDRNNFLIIALAAGGGVAAFLIKVRWPVIVAATFGALTLYSTIEIVRIMPDPTLDAFMEAYEQANAPDPGGSSFGNTTATLRATFEITPDLVPFAYGRYKLIGFAGVIPLIRGYVLPQNSSFNATADALSYYMIGPSANWSVGSNVLSDIYMDFGLLGVPVLMGAIGYLLARVRSAVASHGATAKVVFTYMILVGTVGEIARYSYDFPVRMLTWGLLIFIAYEIIFLRLFGPGRSSARRRQGTIGIVHPKEMAKRQTRG